MCGKVSLTGIHDQVSPDFGFPVVPGGLEALCEADAEVLEVPFAHQGLGRAGGDQRALNGQNQSRPGVEIYAVIGLVGGNGDGSLGPSREEGDQGKHPTSKRLEKAETAGDVPLFSAATLSMKGQENLFLKANSK